MTSMNLGIKIARGQPMGHQVEAIRKAYDADRPCYALFHEMGAGKTFTTLHLAALQFTGGFVRRLLVICPTPIKNVWEDEAAKFLEPGSYDLQVQFPHSDLKQWVIEKTDKLKILVIGIESLSTRNSKSFDLALTFAACEPTTTVVDESSDIKNPKATRTQRVVSLGGVSVYRLILNGTPITQGVEDLFAQYLFLDQSIIGCKNFFVFKNRYCVVGGFQGQQILGYQFVDDLLQRVRPYTHIVKKEDCMDLPEKIYSPVIRVEPTKQQRQALKDLRLEYAAEDQGEVITVNTVLERLLRYQQIAGGTFPFEEGDQYNTKPISGKNPKIEAMKEIIREIPQRDKIIIWARFRPEIQYIVDAIRNEYGEASCVEFHGGILEEDRRQSVALFQSDPTVRFMVSNQSVGGYGQTWTAATYVIYYSNSFSYRDRVQSEDRCHRKGQTRRPTYFDIELDCPEDRMIIKAIRSKKGVAQAVESKLKSKPVNREDLTKIFFG